MISKFISGLSAQGKKLLVFALIVVFVCLFDRLLIAPTMSRLATIQEETQLEKQAIREDLRFLSHKDRIVKEAQVMEPYIVEKLPSENEVITALLKKIEILATKSNVVLAKVIPPVAQEDTDYVKYSADVECSGTLPDLVAFMHSINTSNELMKVVKFNLSAKKSETDDIKATLTILKVIIPKQPLATKTADNKTPSDASAPKKN